MVFTKRKFCTLLGVLLCITGILFGFYSFYMRTPVWVEKQKLKCHHEEWADGRCTYCGTYCRHGTWENGKCTICGTACQHEWAEGACRICGVPCEHRYFINGICDLCGYICEDHTWENGICTICGTACIHEKHDPYTLRCLECEEIRPHHFYDGKCDCGKEPEYYYSWLPEELYEPCEHQGTVKNITYTQKLYSDPNGGTVEKKLNVYLPYGYDDSKQYNVMILVHGGFGDENDLITTNHDYYGFNLNMQNIYDNLFEAKLCEPMIIVCPATYNGPDYTMDSGFENFSQELRDSILPYIANNYATYAASGNLNDIRTARRHFGIGGISNGSLYAMNSGMQMNFDLFSNYICLSGDNQPQEVSAAINSEEWGSLPIDMFFAGAGTWDEQNWNVTNGYQIILASTERLSDEENAILKHIEGGHEWRTWSTDFWNGLQAVFPQ